MLKRRTAVDVAKPVVNLVKAEPAIATQASTEVA